MRQVVDHIYRAQMAHSCGNMDKLREELEIAAKIAEEKILQSASPTNTGSPKCEQCKRYDLAKKRHPMECYACCHYYGSLFTLRAGA